MVFYVFQRLRVERATENINTLYVDHKVLQTLTSWMDRPAGALH